MNVDLAYGYFVRLLKAAGQGTALGGKYLKRTWTGKRWQYEYKPVSQRGAHELTKDRFEKVTKISDSTHKDAIEKALQNGQHVNVRILRAYPDLIKKYGQEKRVEKADRINKKVKELLGKQDTPKVGSSPESIKIEGNYAKGIKVKTFQSKNGYLCYEIKSPYIPELVSAIQQIKTKSYLPDKAIREKLGVVSFNPNDKTWNIPETYKDDIAKVLDNYKQSEEQPKAEIKQGSSPIPKKEEPLKQSQNWGMEQFHEGQLVETKDGLKKVSKVQSRYIPEDGLSFGLNRESGYLYSPTFVDATPEDKAKFESNKNEAANESKLADNLRTALKSLSNSYDSSKAETPKQIDFPKGEKVKVGDTEYILDNDTLYRANYNGRDGDDWSYNNSGGYIIQVTKDQDAINEFKKAQKEKVNYDSFKNSKEQDSEKQRQKFVEEQEKNKVTLKRGSASYDPRTERYTIHFEYNPNDVDKIKNIEGRKFHPESKTWSVPKSEIEKVKEIFSQQKKEISNRQARKMAIPRYW